MGGGACGASGRNGKLYCHVRGPGENYPGFLKIETDHIREIVLSLRNFSRLDESERKSVNIHEGLDSTLLILNHRTKAGIDITKEYGDLPLVECFLSQLSQIFIEYPEQCDGCAAGARRRSAQKYFDSYDAAGGRSRSDLDQGQCS